MAPLLEGQAWFKYDMHHLLWEPRLGVKRFFELYAETWRRSILNTAGKKNLLDWFKQVPVSEFPSMLKVMRRTQRLMNPSAYLAEHTASFRHKPSLPCVNNHRSGNILGT